jgi:hypothetical protein
MFGLRANFYYIQVNKKDMKSHNVEKKKCQCYICNKVTMRTYNFTLNKWSRKFKCKCGSESFRWYNW